MKQGYLILGAFGIGALGFIAYKKFFDSESGSAQGMTPYASPNAAYAENKTAGGQPSEQYPYQSISAPRVDNADQPWYSGPRNLSTPQSANVSNIQGAATDIAAVGSIVDNLSSIWDQLGLDDMWSSGGDSFSTEDESFNWDQLS